MSGTSSNARFTRKPALKTTKPKQAEWIGFVRCELTDIHKEDLKANPYTERQLLEWVGGMALLGCKVTITFDSGNQMVVASLTERDPGSINAGLTLSGRGKHVVGALSSLLYKEQVIIGDRPWSEFSSLRDPDDFG